MEYDGDSHADVATGGARGASGGCKVDGRGRERKVVVESVGNSRTPGGNVVLCG